MIKVCLLAPIHNSLYARLLSDLLMKEEGIQVSGITVRSHLNYRRFTNEFRRDGSRLIRKIVDKWLLGDARFSDEDDPLNLAATAKAVGLQYGSLKEFARAHQIPYLQVRDHNDQANHQFLEGLQPRLILFTGGGLLRKRLLEIPEWGVLNCHSGILPGYRGMDVVEWTAAEKRMEEVGFGVTLHRMDAGVDTGPILLIEKIPVRQKDSFVRIRQRIEVKMVDVMLEGVRRMRDGTLTVQPQAPQDGRQYYVMHPRIKAYAADNLKRFLKDQNISDA